MTEHPLDNPLPGDEPDPEDAFAEVGRYPSLKSAADRGLVILAMGQAYWVFQDGGAFRLCVKPEIGEAALDQLARFEAENTNWPPVATTLRQYGKRHILPALVYCLLLSLIHLANVQRPAVELSQLGRMDAVAVLSGAEWWRLITALTLHADIGHLTANLATGVFFALFAARRFGYGLGWLMILLAGGFGNLLTAWFYFPQPHLSLGASTAVFGALGLLALPIHFRGAAGPIARRATLISFAAAVAVLGLFGAGGARTDVLAHLTGFGAGVGLGWLGAKVPSRLFGNTTFQQLCAVLGLALVAGAWWFARR